MRKRNEIKNKLLKEIGDTAISLGGKAVGKCIIVGFYDPKIPQALKDEKKQYTYKNVCKRIIFTKDESTALPRIRKKLT